MQRKDEISLQSLKQLQQLSIFSGHCIREMLIDLHSDLNVLVTETILNIFGRGTLFSKHGRMGVTKTVIIGGLGSLPGAVIGALLLGVLETLITGFVSSAWRDVFSFSLMIVILIFRPFGLMGKSKGEKI